MFLMRLLVGKGRGAGFLLPQPRLKSSAHRGPGPGSPGVAPDIVSPALPLVNLEIWRWWSHSGADHWPLITIMRQGDGSVRTGVTCHAALSTHVSRDSRQVTHLLLSGSLPVNLSVSFYASSQFISMISSGGGIWCLSSCLTSLMEFQYSNATLWCIFNLCGIL